MMFMKKYKRKGFVLLFSLTLFHSIKADIDRIISFIDVLQTIRTYNTLIIWHTSWVLNNVNFTVE